MHAGGSQSGPGGRFCSDAIIDHYSSVACDVCSLAAAEIVLASAFDLCQFAVTDTFELSFVDSDLSNDILLPQLIFDQLSQINGTPRAIDIRHRKRRISYAECRMTKKPLRALTMGQVQFIAVLARAARAQRDSLLDNVAENDLGEPKPGRGEHNPTATLGFEPLSPGASQTVALGEGVLSLSEVARRELYALMRTGQGHLSAKKWRDGLLDAEVLGDAAVTAAINEDADLHDHLAKALYELGLSE